jgi:hypothetical protein
MLPEEIAPLAIDGLLNGDERIIPGRLNRFFIFLDKLLPAWLKNKMAFKQIKKLNTRKVEKLLKGERMDDDKKAA